MLNRATIITRGRLIWWLLFNYTPCIKNWLMHNNFCPTIELAHRRGWQQLCLECDLKLVTLAFLSLGVQFLRSTRIKLHVFNEKNGFHCFSYF
jgi:hypothetical protein